MRSICARTATKLDGKALAGVSEAGLASSGAGVDGTSGDGSVGSSSTLPSSLSKPRATGPGTKAGASARKLDLGGGVTSMRGAGVFTASGVTSTDGALILSARFKSTRALELHGPAGVEGVCSEFLGVAPSGAAAADGEAGTGGGLAGGNCQAGHTAAPAGDGGAARGVGGQLAGDIGDCGMPSALITCGCSCLASDGRTAGSSSRLASGT
mmetsp:Transcript_98480/g.175409  ORF Transcript_98480/g.175409 Transcript_98480/m.175409 type:complete len:211 (+) Transcript_98480:827-1459(+)